MNNSYLAKAYTEVLELISYLPEEEYLKIPKKRLNFFIEKSDKNYKYNINPKIDLDKQVISKEASMIILTIFRDYFSTDKQKEILINILQQNQKELDEENKIKYNLDNLFKDRKHKIETVDNSVAMVGYKESFFTKFINKLKNFFHIK